MRIVQNRRTPRQKRAHETVTTLVEAAAQVFSREGADATTNRIAERAGRRRAEVPASSVEVIAAVDNSHLERA
ncbi:TetR family transcriptional regulator [Mycolicibacterium iranicum]|uniref:Uncharacterized protein n=1 Tax=Mycolicibacterium iranicum TaxID=912594 RepID=A0A178LPY0_MYCIR|nr:TetR family transcriptional regulator [Mycolicibacterium iranicum]OAN34502.1 hypothetical protein A4X20_07340 [Mycolicibacterium iranicum]